MTESWSGRSTRTSPARSSSPRSSSLAREYRYLGGTASHSRIAPDPSSPHTQAWAFLDTGPLTPPLENSPPPPHFHTRTFPPPPPTLRTPTLRPTYLPLA